MSKFKNLNTTIYAKPSSILTSDQAYWKEFETPVLVKEFGPIDYLNFSEVNPKQLAVTSSVRVQIYNAKIHEVEKSITRFKTTAFGATFRNDSSLLLAGSQDGIVRLFNASTGSMLRVFKGHKTAVHRVSFLKNNTQMVSFSDDRTVRVWDIGSEDVLWTSPDQCFTDYIRSGAVNKVADDIVIAGSYDNTIKQFDVRSNNVAMTFNLGHPVEQVMFHSLGHLIVSCGGPVIKIWDARSSDKVLETISEHFKTVTCLCLNSDSKYLISGSLDRTIRVFETNFYKQVTSFSYSNDILSCDISNNDEILAVGMVDGTVLFRNKAIKTLETANDLKTVSFRTMAHLQPKYVDVNVFEDQHSKQTKFDMCLRKFKYRKALDIGLLSFYRRNRPEQTISILYELIRRNALQKVIKNRDELFISNLLKFIIRYYYYSDHYQKVLSYVTSLFLTTYMSQFNTFSISLSQLFLRLNNCYKKEVLIHQKAFDLIGVIEMIMTD